MKALRIYVLLLLSACWSDGIAQIHPDRTATVQTWPGAAQSDLFPTGLNKTVPAGMLAGLHALSYADSLIAAFRHSRWIEYLDLSYPGIIQYYGGRQGFLEYLHRSRVVAGGLMEERPEEIELIQLDNDRSEWQCVVRKTRRTQIDNRPASVVSYMVGQSKDDGRSWRYFDVAYNSAENVVYIMPDIFSTLIIPQRQIIFLQDNLTTCR